MKTKNQLVEFMAKACYYAQENCGDPETWSTNIEDREEYFQCVSYQIACFLAQNTVEGHGGVDWDIILPCLVEVNININGDRSITMVKSIKEWKKILNKLAKELGGWKKECLTSTE